MLSFQNGFINGVYPSAPSVWLFMVTLVLALYLANVDISLGLIGRMEAWPW